MLLGLTEAEKKINESSSGPGPMSNLKDKVRSVDFTLDLMGATGV